VNPSQDKRLLVEGYDDLFAVAGLMRNYVDWPKEKDKYPVWIDAVGSVDKILERDYLSVLLKGTNIKTLGIMLDADINASARFSSIKDLCHNFFNNLPDKLPKDGLIADNNDGKRIGLWVMPDNVSNGAVEVFLKHLVPDGSAHIWNHAVQSVRQAVDIGATCRAGHIDKANLFTWLAWQDEPGQNPGNALTRKILDPHAESAKPFVAWFVKLFSLEFRKELSLS
jgi:hypothetical protein